MVGRRQASLAIAVICYLIAVLAARPVATPGPFVRDFEAYWSAGKTANDGFDPYGRDVWQAERSVPGVNDSRDELLPFVGPPQSLWLWRGAAMLNYALAARIWWTTLALAIAALAVSTLIGAGLRPRVPPIIGAVLLAFSFGPITSALALGQVAILAIAAACVGVLLARTPHTAIVTLAAAVASLQPNVALGIVSIARRARGAIALATAAAIAYLAGAAMNGWSWPVAYARLLLEHARAERFSAIQFVPSSIFNAAGVAPHAAIVLGVVVASVAACAAIATFFTLSETYARFACVSALLPFVTGFVHEHDLIVAFPAVMLAAGRARGAVRAMTIVGTLLVAIDWLGMAQRPSGIVQTALLAISAGLMFSAFGAGEIGDAIGAAVVVPILAASAWIAMHHPLPVWPDALGAFHAAHDATASAVWRMELTRNGLIGIAAATAWLRSLSLAGCALLAAGVWSIARRDRALEVDVHEVIERRPRIGLEPG